MTWGMVAVGGALAYSAYSGRQAASQAADAQVQGSERASQVQQDIFNKQVELQAPFREAGLTGQNRLMDLLGLSGRTGAQGYGSAAKPFGEAEFKTDPGYAFRLSEGQKALERSAAARGGLISGGAMKAATRYGQEMGSQEYGNAFNRYQAERSALINPLQSLTGQAQSSANTLTGAAGNLGAQLGENIMGGANARASGYVGEANALSSAIGSGVNFYGGQQYLSRLPIRS
jgi:hypothetical protein